MSRGFALLGYHSRVAKRCSSSATPGGSSRFLTSAALQQSLSSTTSPPAFSFGMTNGYNPPPPNGVSVPKDVRMRFAEPSSDGVEVGFTDGTQFNFPVNWLRSMIAGFTWPVNGPTIASRVLLNQGASDMTVQWGQDTLKKSTFDGNMLRAFAEHVGQPIKGPNIEEQRMDVPFRGPAVWTGPELAASPWWGHMLTDMDIQDLKAATREAAKKVQWRAPGVPEIIPKEDFPLTDTLQAKLQSIADELEYGKGLVMIRNMPVQDPDLSEEDLAIMYLGISAHLGHVVMQSSSGLRSVSRGYGMPLGRIQAEMTGETPVGGLQANNTFRLHTDRCDVISLMSLRTAPTGGASRICSAPAVYNTILQKSPELAKVLAQPIDRIWEGEKGYFRLPVVGVTPSGQFTTQISPSYVENAQYLEGTVKATSLQIAALDAIEEVGMDLGVEFMMKPGMLYFLNNHQVYHGRSTWSVTDGESTGRWGQEGRLLYRTWISPYNSRALPDLPEYRNVWGSVQAGKLRGGWDQAVKTGEVPKPKMPDGHVYYSLYDEKVQERTMSGKCATVLEY